MLLSLAQILKDWKHRLRLRREGLPSDLIRRAQARQESRMAWWRLVLALVPMTEAMVDESRSGGVFSYAVIVYALIVLVLANRRNSPPILRWVFAFGDVAALQAYVYFYLGGRTSAAEAAYAYVATANVVLFTNSLRLSLPVLWTSAGGIVACYFLHFMNSMQDSRVRIGGVMLLLIGVSLASMIVRGQLRLLAESRVSARLRRFVSPEVAEDLERRKDVMDMPAAREVTVLFVDIRGFTPSAETMAPEDSVAFLNQFFHRVTQSVYQHQGTIDKYIGDCVMVLFGAPLSQPDDATRAVKAAQGILRSVQEWNIERALSGLPPVKIGIGLNTSRVVAGAVGTPQKLEYTVIGDGVNVAARVCALTKEHPAPILVTESTRKRVNQEMPWIDFGQVTLRGRSQTLNLYGLNG